GAILFLSFPLTINFLRENFNRFCPQMSFLSRKMVNYVTEKVDEDGQTAAHRTDRLETEVSPVDEIDTDVISSDDITPDELIPDDVDLDGLSESELDQLLKQHLSDE
ncbi:MAG: hypothetical protein MI802_05785, partial [Desulfobacterales bacterium]|nr:hypothetical protein [Desulfobacterales bacterium]